MFENDTLLNKSKEELVDIILRKDDVERQHVKDIRELKHRINIQNGDMAVNNIEIRNLKEEKDKLIADTEIYFANIKDNNDLIDTLINDRDKITNEYEEVCDEYTTYIVETKKELNRIYRNNNILLILLALCTMLGLWFILQFVLL